MIQSKKHKYIKYEGYEFLDVETLDYFCGQLLYSSDSYSLDNKTTILKYNKQGYDELIRYIHKIIGSPQ